LAPFVREGALLADSLSVLASIETRSAQGASLVIGPANLPSLEPAGRSSAYRDAQIAVETRRERASERLGESLDLQMELFSEASAQRLERLIAQRRAELQAIARSEQSQAEEEARAQVDAAMRTRIDAVTPDLSVTAATAEALRQQLAQTSEGPLAAPLDTKREREEIDTLRAAASVREVRTREGLRQAIADLRGPQPELKPSARARVSVMADAASRTQRALEATVSAAWDTAMRERDEAVAAVRLRPLEAIEAQIEELRSENETAFLDEDARLAAARARALEGDLGRRSEAGSAPKTDGGRQRASLPKIDTTGARRRLQERVALARRLATRDEHSQRREGYR
jgi:hypothetical protein